MKKNKFLVFRTLAIMLVFLLVGFAGCGSTPQAGRGNGVSAAPTATDLVRALDGKAAVNGSTVTLTGDVTLTASVRIENALTVPSGVTLDLTKETLTLGNNAVLTVNGTVNAKAEGINIDSATASPATINGSGTIYLKSKGSLLNIENGKKLTLDSVTLVGLPDNTALVRVWQIGELVMNSGVITGNTNTDEWPAGGGVRAEGKDVTFIMNGGTISGNTVRGDKWAYGGGVFVGDSTFIMNGGTISGNSVFVSGNGNDSKGGGVLVGGDTGTFIMKGGEISGNSFTNESYNSEVGGGGVGILKSATFIMEGGIIYGSSAGDKANTTNSNGAALILVGSTAKWGIGGTYTKGGVPHTGGSNIVETSGTYRQGGTNDTLVAIPAK